MTTGEKIINRFFEYIKDIQKGKKYDFIVDYADWQELSYDEKSIIHDLMTKYSMQMSFDNNNQIVSIIYNK